MHALPLLLALVPALPATTAGQGQATLVPGSEAPPLSIASWIQGEPVKALERGQVYVLEFWATWCSPCLASMPHVSRLAAQYAERGVTVIGITSTDSRGNTLERVREMVREKADVLRYRVAWDKGRETNEAYLRAAGQNSIPTSFVIDREGRIAYIGHPMFLDEPLAGVVAGTWNAAVDAQRLTEDARRFLRFYAEVRVDPAGTLESLATFEKAHPRLIALTEPFRFTTELATQRHEAALATGRRILERAGNEGDVATLTDVAGAALDAAAFAGGPELASELAGRAVEMTARKDARALGTLARAQAVLGDLARAEALIGEALAIAPPGDRAELGRILEDVRTRQRAAAGE
jgi:thiol-disulfide isomerase/thioredoxin